MSTRSTLAIPLLLATLATPVSAGVVRGIVHVPAMVSPETNFNPYAGHATSMPGHMHVKRGLVTDAVLSIASVPAAVDSTLPAPAGRAQQAQRDQSFVPRVVAIPLHASVDFPNEDPIYHNVFSVSPVKRFDLGKYPRGQSRTLRFDRAGVVNVYCDIHSDMAGFIVVLPNRAFTRPGEDGAYRLPELPAGHYVLRWWHPDFPPGEREIDVPADGTTVVDVTF